MRVAIIGSRNSSSVTASKIISYLPKSTNEIVSGGARGIDTIAQEVAQTLELKLTVFYPRYNSFGRSAPIKRNIDIVDNADYVIAFWDFKSKGTQNVILRCLKTNTPFKVIKI